MLEEGYIEILDNEVITGTKLESLMRMGNFYNQFISTQVYKVYNDKGMIGEIDIRPDIQVDTNIYLAGSIWRIEKILSKNKKILVEPASAGKAPRFTGQGDQDVSDAIRGRMKMILEYPDMFSFDGEINEIIEDLREEYTNDDYLFVASKDTISIRTFKNSKINRTLAIMLNIISNSTKYQNFEVDSTVTGPDLIYYFDELRMNQINIEQVLRFLKENEGLVDGLLSSNKYMVLVPRDLKIQYIINNRLDLEGTYAYLGYKDN